MRGSWWRPAAWLGCAAVTIVTIAPCLAEERPQSPSDLAAEVRRLLNGLTAPTRAERAASRERLLELGPQVLPHLPALELLPTASVRASVDQVRQELERRHARESVRPSHVTLQGTRSLGDWLAEIVRQTKNPIDATGFSAAALGRSFTLDIRSREFWPVLDDLASRGDFTFEAEPTKRGLKLLAGARATDESALSVAYAGAFRLQAKPAEIVPIVERGVEGDGSPRKRLARVALAIQSEPRLRPLFLQYTSAGISARTGDAKPLRPFNPEASYEQAVAEAGGHSRVQLDYVLIGEPPRTLNLQGTFHMTTAADSVPIRFVDIAKQADGKPIGVERRSGGVTVTLNRVRRERGDNATQEVRVQVTVAYDTGGPAFESHRTWILHNEVYLERGDATRLPVNGGFETTLQGDGAVGMEYRFVGLPDPLPNFTFVYVAPTLIVDVPVEFVLESVPVKATKAAR